MKRVVLVSTKKKIAIIGNECVACGVCISACPKRVIEIYKGIIAVVDESECLGCGKCAKECPAGVIIVTEVART